MTGRHSSTDDPQARLALKEDVDAVRQAVVSLPEHYREAVVLCDLEQLSYMDAAEALGCAVGTIRSRLRFVSDDGGVR